MVNSFLAIDKAYLGTGLKSIDILIMAQIEEFQRNKCSCYVTNEQFSAMFGESVSTVKRSLDKLEEKKLIVRQKHTIKGNGRANTERLLSISNDKVKQLSKCKVQKEQCEGQNASLRGSNPDNGRFKSNECEVHNEPVKNNLKENKKENLKDNETKKAKKEIANASENGDTKNRTIKDLTIDEGNAIYKAIKDHKDTYANLQQKYGLEFGSITKDFPRQWEHERNNRSYKAEQEWQKRYGKKEPYIDYSRFVMRKDPPQKQGTRPRWDLSLEEGETIIELISEGKLSIEEISEKYNMKPGEITKNFSNDWDRSHRYLKKVKELEEEGKTLDDLNWDEVFPEDKLEENVWGEGEEKPLSLKILEEWKRQKEQEEKELEEIWN